METPVLEVTKLCMYYRVQDGLFSGASGGLLKAVDGVSFCIRAGETLGLVGESGCGKSTLARCLVRLEEPVSGTIRLQGVDVTHKAEWRLKRERHLVQLVFQDAADALNPRLDVRRIISEPMEVQGGFSRQEQRARVDELLELVGLPKSAADQFPHEFSGGQRQRICIARALAGNPKLLILDEPVSALDVSVRAQVLNLLMELQRELGLAYLLISHDLGVVRHVSDRVAVMYMGKIVEMAAADVIYNDARHAYTKALLSALPTVGERRSACVLPRTDDAGPIDPLPGSAYGRRIRHPLLEATYGMDMTPVEIEPGHWLAPDPCALSREDLAALGVEISLPS